MGGEEGQCTTPPRYYCTHDPDMAHWLLDEMGLPLAGKLVFATATPKAAREVTDKLGQWEFMQTRALVQALVAWCAGPRARAGAVAHALAQREHAAQQAWKEAQESGAKTATYVTANIVHDAQLASLDRNLGTETDPYTLGANMSEDNALLSALGAGERRPTPISPHPRYQAALDRPEVALAALWHLYVHEHWRLLNEVGVGKGWDRRQYNVRDNGRSKGRALRGWNEVQALDDAWYIVGQQRTLTRGAGLAVLMVCPFLHAACERLLMSYRQRTHHRAVRVQAA